MNLDLNPQAVVIANKEQWTKPEITVIGIGTQTLGTSSLHGFDAGAFPNSSS